MFVFLNTKFETKTHCNYSWLKWITQSKYKVSSEPLQFSWVFSYSLASPVRLLKKHMTLPLRNVRKHNNPVSNFFHYVHETPSKTLLKVLFPTTNTRPAREHIDDVPPVSRTDLKLDSMKHAGVCWDINICPLFTHEPLNVDGLLFSIVIIFGLM